MCVCVRAWLIEPFFAVAVDVQGVHGQGVRCHVALQGALDLFRLLRQALDDWRHFRQLTSIRCCRSLLVHLPVCLFLCALYLFWHACSPECRQGPNNIAELFSLISAIPRQVYSVAGVRPPSSANLKSKQIAIRCPLNAEGSNRCTMNVSYIAGTQAECRDHFDHQLQLHTVFCVADHVCGYRAPRWNADGSRADHSEPACTKSVLVSNYAAHMREHEQQNQLALNKIKVTHLIERLGDVMLRSATLGGAANAVDNAYAEKFTIANNLTQKLITAATTATRSDGGTMLRLLVEALMPVIGAVDAGGLIPGLGDSLHQLAETWLPPITTEFFNGVEYGGRQHIPGAGAAIPAFADIGFEQPYDENGFEQPYEPPYEPAYDNPIVVDD